MFTFHLPVLPTLPINSLFKCLLKFNFKGTHFILALNEEPVVTVRPLLSVPCPYPLSLFSGEHRQHLPPSPVSFAHGAGWMCWELTLQAAAVNQ